MKARRGGAGAKVRRLRRRWLASLRVRLADLIGSMLLAAIVVLVVSLVVVLFRMSAPSGSPIELNQYAWLALSAIVGTWSIMIPAKVWEYRPADAALRRFVMLVLGLGVGFAAYGLYTWLLVQLPYDFHDQLAHGIMTARLRHGFYGPDGAPLIFAFLAYFGLLWLVPRWWRQAYLRRSTRLSIWSVVVTLFWAAAHQWHLAVPAALGIDVRGDRVDRRAIGQSLADKESLTIRRANHGTSFLHHAADPIAIRIPVARRRRHLLLPRDGEQPVELVDRQCAVAAAYLVNHEIAYCQDGAGGRSSPAKSATAEQRRQFAAAFVGRSSGPLGTSTIEVYVATATAGPYPTIDECNQALPAEIDRAVTDFAEKEFQPASINRSNWTAKSSRII